MKNQRSKSKAQSRKGRILKTITLLFLIFALCTFNLGQREALAQDMSSQNFKLQQGNFNMTSGNKASANFRLSDVLGQTAAGVFNSKGFILNAGFLNGAAGDVFTFSIDPQTIDFGSLTANTIVDKIIHISVSNGNTHGFSVHVAENTPLKTTVGAEITDTTCDSPTSPCTQTQASIWESIETYGFGYRITGRNTPADFVKEAYFRPFPSVSRNEQPALLMLTQATKVVEQAKLTLRLNVSPKQSVGQYKNILQFSALVGI